MRLNRLLKATLVALLMSLVTCAPTPTSGQNSAPPLKQVNLVEVKSAHGGGAWMNWVKDPETGRCYLVSGGSDPRSSVTAIPVSKEECEDR